MLAFAALSARALVQSAADEGLPALALDVFGDVDTRSIAAQWLPIGAAGALRIDAPALLAALDALCHRGDVTGWIAGSGFEGRADLLAAGAARLPLIGTAAAAVARVRDARIFFDALASHGIDHPPVRFAPPQDPAGWLCKNMAGCGGWQVRRAEAPADPEDEPAAGQDGAPSAAVAGRYWQREVAGLPMSATFVANGRDAVVLGFNQQCVQSIGPWPYVFCGVSGPVAVNDLVQARITHAVRRLTAHFCLRGLGSLDFLLHGDTAWVLEINPRPPASMPLYPQVGAGGPVQAHLDACLGGHLPAAQAPVPAPIPGARGSAIVFARCPLSLDVARAQAIAAWPGTCDLPAAGTHFEAGEPVCSLTARGPDAAAVRQELACAREALLQTLETWT